MKIDLLVAEIGSTTTVVNGFDGIDSEPSFIGQGQAPTSVLEGDVNIGLKAAIDDLSKLVGEPIEYKELLATSSAAGGLIMSVHGLVYEMTVKAAKEAALGAGANLKLITAGKLRRTDLKKIQEIKPNIILIAGGVDYGERDTAIHNAELIAELNLDIPVIYAGNIENQEEIRLIFENTDAELHIVENVYPRIDDLNIEPTRKVIQEVFEKHIIHAPGMEKMREMVTGHIMPTPGAVMEASKLLYENIGPLITIDVGGATTDIHSVAEDSDEISRMLLNAEPMAKRTVEGDLGVYVNMHNIVERVGKDIIAKEMKISLEDLEDIIAKHQPIPQTDLDKEFVKKLTEHAVLSAVKRHVGVLKDLYGPSGKKNVAEGKDLTLVKYIVGTGGALTRIKESEAILKSIPYSNKGKELLPSTDVEVLLDKDYIMASLGVMSLKYPQEALKLLENSFRRNGNVIS